MANVAERSRNNAPKVPAKLSSGILGMKFMQKDESVTPPPQPEPEQASSQSPRAHREADPGAWFSPFAKNTKIPSTKPNDRIGFAELYGTDRPTEGRRTYGQRPAKVDPEQMAKSFDGNKTAKANKKKSRTERSTPTRKRLSEDDERPARSKRRKS